MSKQSISFLLGAGFSAPMGYPIGERLNKLLLDCDGNDFAFHTSGSLMPPHNGEKVNIGYKTSYDYEYDFCRDLINLFNKRLGYFDYEKFFDFFKTEASQDPEVKELYDPQKYNTQKTLDQMLYAMSRIFNQLVSYFLKDSEGNSWYDNSAHMGKPLFPGYTGILNCLENFGKDCLVNIHTLNHDLFFERLNKTDWINNQLSDGFSDQGSSFYGDLIIEGRTFKCRLERFTNEYNDQYRLYKLHGSKDYTTYYGIIDGVRRPEIYVKTRYGIGFSSLYKEVKDKNGKLTYDKGNFAFHSDFLTGTTTKIERYEEPLIFKTLFKHFKNNLKQAKKLIVIGYGCGDSEINKMIYENYRIKDNPIYIIDPFAGKLVVNFAKKTGAKLIKKELEEIELEDLA